jgi:hypothetical protein
MRHVHPFGTGQIDWPERWTVSSGTVMPYDRFLFIAWMSSGPL